MLALVVVATDSCVPLSTVLLFTTETLARLWGALLEIVKHLLLVNALLLVTESSAAEAEVEAPTVAGGVRLGVVATEVLVSEAIVSALSFP